MEHYAVVYLDREHLRRLAELRRVTRKDIKNAYSVRIECSNPVGCPAFIECSKDHHGFDPHDEDSPAYGEFVDVLIHGEPHEWDSEYGWCVEYPGCWYESEADTSYLDVDRTHPGRYKLKKVYYGDEELLEIDRGANA